MLMIYVKALPHSIFRRPALEVISWLFWMVMDLQEGEYLYKSTMQEGKAHWQR